ncbi:hypothetical protein EVAR_97669_1 [Eumeta japonica]|uniref:Pacifastin domain-containing protein n=1 Tax=Eumeta variegata TaxID=151549 RepID=A0A4C1WWP0_EUMVA|nr:hypothetical protein EVAR_97669_1 [Eumeta japonica]
MFVRDCNTCWCNDDGTTYFCTRRACVPNTPEEVVGVEDVKPEDLVRVPQRDCRPDEVFEIDCNVCRCNPDGESFSCTRRLCARDPPTVGVAEVYPDEQNTTLTRRPRRQVNSKGLVKTCLPGQEFRVDCNKCLCDNEGQDFSCTRLDCAALNNHNGGTRNKREVVQQAVNHCEPGTVFDQGCNVCRCTSDGRHATCSLKKCSIKPSEEEESQSDPNFRCTPGEQFTRTCNDCTCSADGLAVFCTLRLCENDIAGKI